MAASKSYLWNPEDGDIGTVIDADLTAGFNVEAVLPAPVGSIERYRIILVQP